MVNLASTGQIYVSLAAALTYQGLPSEAGINLGLEEVRRALTVRLLEAKRQTSQDRGELEAWRLRAPWPLSALVSREGALAVIVSVQARQRP